MLPFDSANYAPEVASLLALDGDGHRPMELFPRACASAVARDLLLRASPRHLFPGARAPEAALSGLLLYFSCLTEAHDLLHRFTSLDGAFWHAIMHRMEGDLSNAAWWFRRIPSHPVYPALLSEAVRLGYPASGHWDPFAFIRFCESSASSGGELAGRVQLAEWQLLFDYCAAPVQAGAPLRERAAAR